MAVRMAGCQYTVNKGKTVSLLCRFCLIMAVCTTGPADLSLRCTSMLLGANQLVNNDNNGIDPFSQEDCCQQCWNEFKSQSRQLFSDFGLWRLVGLIIRDFSLVSFPPPSVTGNTKAENKCNLKLTCIAGWAVPFHSMTELYSLSTSMWVCVCVCVCVYVCVCVCVFNHYCCCCCFVVEFVFNYLKTKDKSLDCPQIFMNISCFPNLFDYSHCTR